MIDTLRQRFHDLHATDTFVMPNPFDVGSAKLLEHLGFPALATTSSGHAATLGRNDQHVTRDELLRHVEAITSAVTVPVNVDSEYCFADDLHGIADTVRLLAAAGASGCSIEDYNPATRAIDPMEVSSDRVATAAAAANEHGMLLTARTEGLLYGRDDVDGVIDRLVAFWEAGADCVYAPGLRSVADIRRAVEAVDVAVNVLAMPDVPPVPELAALGVRRISVGGALAWAAYRGLERAARQLITDGTFGYLDDILAADLRNSIFT